MTLMTYIHTPQTRTDFLHQLHIGDATGQESADPLQKARIARTRIDSLALDLDVLNRCLVALVCRQDTHATVDGEHVLDANADTFAATVAA